MPSADLALDFCMGFVANSERYTRQFREAQEEVVANVMVKLDYEDSSRGNSPYKNQPVYRSHRRQVMLKDNETSKVITTYKAKLMRALFGDNHREYVRAQPSGFEDAKKSRATTGLLRYTFNGPGHYRTFDESTTDYLMFGTSIIESPWRYEERDTIARSMQMDPMTGEMTSTFSRMKYPAYDDVCLRNIDPMDFYPDPSRYRLEDMSGCAKRFRMNAYEAKRMGLYDQAKVKEAIEKGTGKAGTDTSTDNFRRGLDQPQESAATDGAKDMIGYEYWGDVDEEIALYDTLTQKKIKMGRGVITVLNGVVVRADAWPLADYCLPFHSFIINPMTGRFFGLSPAETIRYDQSFADAVKILLAEAIVRRVHPPIAFDPDADVDISKIKIWKSDALISARGGPNAIGTVKYDADINGGFALLSGLKQGMQEGSGALGAIQGESGPDRESASVGSQRLQFAMDRPEMAAMFIENDCLPPLAKGVIRRYQQFLEDDSDLQRRIGEVPGATLEDIMGDFDVQFYGSRQTMNRQQRLQGVDRLVSLAQVMPSVQMVLPSIELAQMIIGDLMEMPDVAMLVGQNPQMMEANMLAMQMGGQGGPAQNGVPPGPQPAGMLPEQAAGGLV